MIEEYYYCVIHDQAKVNGREERDENAGKIIQQHYIAVVESKFILLAKDTSQEVCSNFIQIIEMILKKKFWADQLQCTAIRIYNQSLCV